MFYFCVCVYVCTFIYVYKCCLKRSNQSLRILFLILFNVLLVIKIILIKQSHSSIQFCTLFTDNIRKSWFKYLFYLLFLPFFISFFLFLISFFFSFSFSSAHFQIIASKVKASQIYRAQRKWMMNEKFLHQQVGCCRQH